MAVDEDEVERLAKHDEDVRGELAQHDADIKALLDEILARQEEIVRLLLTPQGLRENDLGSWPLKPDASGESESADSPVDTEPPAADGGVALSVEVRKSRVCQEFVNRYRAVRRPAA